MKHAWKQLGVLIDFINIRKNDGLFGRTPQQLSRFSGDAYKRIHPLCMTFATFSYHFRSILHSYGSVPDARVLHRPWH